MHRLVLDTNTYTSGFLWEGNEAKLIRKIESGKASSFISKEILEEIDEVLRRDKFVTILKVANTTADEVLSKIVGLVSCFLVFYKAKTDTTRLVL